MIRKYHNHKLQIPEYRLPIPYIYDPRVYRTLRWTDESRLPELYPTSKFLQLSWKPPTQCSCIPQTIHYQIKFRVHVQVPVIQPQQDRTVTTNIPVIHIVQSDLQQPSQLQSLFNNNQRQHEKVKPEQKLHRGGVTDHVPVRNISINNYQMHKVRKRAKIRNRYNQAPHLTQDTNWKVTMSQ